MRVISMRPLREFWAEHPEAQAPLRRWHWIAKRAAWVDFATLRRDFPNADAVGDYIVFNIGGNKYRLIAEIDHVWGKVFVRAILTHREYDKGDWKS